MAPEVKGGLAAAIVALAAGALVLNRALVGVYYDDGIYAGLALALARGAGYVHLHLPGAPAAVHYPPLYPMLLAPVFGLLSLDVAGFVAKVLNLLLAATATGVAAWHAARARLLGDMAPRWMVPTLAAAAAIAIPVLRTQAVLFAEPLFAVLFAVTITLADAGYAPPSPQASLPQSMRWPPSTYALLAGIAGALTLLTRTIGIALAAGMTLFLLTLRRAPMRHAVLAAAPILVAAAGWGLWTLVHRDGIDPVLAMNYGSYSEVVRAAGLGAVASAGADLWRPLTAITLGWLPSRVLYWVFAVSAYAIGLYGLFLLCRRSSVGLSLVAYLVILATWPYPADRFLWAVLPWLAFAFGAGMVALWRHHRLHAPLTLVAAVLGIGFAIYEVRGFGQDRHLFQAAIISNNFRELLPGLETLPRDAVIATDDEALVWLYTQRTAVPFYLYAYRGAALIEPPPAEHRAYLERQGVTHVLLGDARGGSARQLRALMQVYPGWLAGVRAWSNGRGLFVVTR